MAGNLSLKEVFVRLLGRVLVTGCGRWIAQAQGHGDNFTVRPASVAVLYTKSGRMAEGTTLAPGLE